MKRSDVIDLIRYHVDRDDASFNSKAASIAREFEQQGLYDLASYVLALISETRTFVPMMEEDGTTLLAKVPTSSASLPLPTGIAADLRGIINAVSHGMGVNKFLFVGAPGTGKTESAKQIARILRRELYVVNFASIVDSRLGETSRNIVSLFNEIRAVGTHGVVLFDEIDALALDRVNSNDVREMGRATSTMLTQLDTLDSSAVLIATTNLFSKLDHALVRRFDKVVDFDRYEKDDLVEIGVSIASSLIAQVDTIKSDQRLLKKILETAPHLPFPGDLKNLIRSAIAFSDPANGSDYLVRLYHDLNGQSSFNLQALKNQGYTVREMEILTGIPKSTISRSLRSDSDE